MLREAILDVTHVEHFGMIALIVMFALFVGVIIWAVRIDKQDIDTLGRLPLDSVDEKQKVRK